MQNDINLFSQPKESGVVRSGKSGTNCLIRGREESKQKARRQRSSLGTSSGLGRCCSPCLQMDTQKDVSALVSWSFSPCCLKQWWDPDSSLTVIPNNTRSLLSLNNHRRWREVNKCSHWLKILLSWECWVSDRDEGSITGPFFKILTDACFRPFIYWARVWLGGACSLSASGTSQSLLTCIKKRVVRSSTCVKMSSSRILGILSHTSNTVTLLYLLITSLCSSAKAHRDKTRWRSSCLRSSQKVRRREGYPAPPLSRPHLPHPTHHSLHFTSFCPELKLA